ncbi:hypothetical protein KR222_000295, partial [Zaprionus bogoriensis]
ELNYKMSRTNENNNSRNSDLDLHMALIEYATSSSRLLFVQDVRSFDDFPVSNEAFSDLSSFELCAMFLNEILPNIRAYPLADRTRERLKLLELNPCIRKTAQGYQYAPLQLDAPNFALKPSCDFTLGWQLPPQSRKLLPATANSGSSHTMLFAGESEAGASRSFQLSHDIAILFSAALSTDLELSSAQLHSTPQLCRRMQRAKQCFEDAGNIAPYRSDLPELVDNLVAFEQLRTRICGIMY